MIDNLETTLKEFGKVHGGPLAEFDKFHYIVDPNKHTLRRWDICRHVELMRSEGHAIKRWVALDDDFSLRMKGQYADFIEGHYLICDSNKGLTNEITDQAIAILTKDE